MSTQSPESDSIDDEKVVAKPAEELVWHIKLMNGEDIMGRIKLCDRSYRVYEPMVMREIGDGGETVGLGLIRYISGAEWKFCDFAAPLIVTMVPATEKLENYYDQAVRYSAVYTDKNFDKAVELATGQLSGRIDHINRMNSEDPVKAEITEEEFKVMPVEGFA